MAATEIKNKGTTSTKKSVIIQMRIGYEQLLDAVQQLPDEKRIELLNELQTQLEAEKLIKPRTDEDQRKEAQKEDRKAMMERFIEKTHKDGVELDEELNDKELLELIKNI